ncbi:MAG TPA: hypothetical protein VNO79_15835 [Actinomycetota bacterium]|nr:hypothetical protein [Actinomycetota bacterium]
MSPAAWLRRRAEDALLEAAQAEMARRAGRPARPARRGPAGFFWRRVFVPAYRLLPWRLRWWVLRTLPGSHRRRWRGRGPPRPRPALGA